ncbi:hypothetical protein KFE25_007972 [Diacronema lutheri]|uniref:tRNA/rRNA methyltransferase SpoU type domain-containing protein n=1 Tax=Diacronema lutheri TaxID=2081491 RepID=A0A8J5XGC0_DIALT|nr:hypothetical protein KFE25_007972 [Diacronema lutheri]
MAAKLVAAGSENLRPLLILYNVSKKKNFGELIRTAAAFGACEVVVVGMHRLMTHGAHGADKALRFTQAPTLDSAIAYAREEHGAHICGIEIIEGAQPVSDAPFRGRTAFMVGNEGQGMPECQMRACDHFVYIAQYSAATASLNINCAAAIVLEHYARWARLGEAPRDGYKYVTHAVAPSSLPRSGMGVHQMRRLSADRAGGAAASDGSSTE